MSYIEKARERRGQLRSSVRLKELSAIIKEHKGSIDYGENKPSNNEILKGLYELQLGNDLQTLKTKISWFKLGYVVNPSAEPLAFWGKPRKIGTKTRWPKRFVYSASQVIKIEATS